MKYSAAINIVAGALAAAQTPGGAIPAGIQIPDTTGFSNPVLLPSRGGRAICVSGKFPVTATSTKNAKLNFSLPKNQTALTQAFLSLVTPGSNFSKTVVGGMQTVSGTYQIAGSLCMPAQQANTTAIQLLTHGIGFDRYYWDFAPGYSYVDVAADSGRATFLYDRLGVGASDKPDALNVVQGALEVEIARGIACQLREGNFGKKYSQVVGVGHSFGSLITESITSQYPTELDAGILTGFSANQSGLAGFVLGSNFAIAAQDQPYRFSDLDTGYLVAGSAISNQINFFHFPGFDPSIVAAANAQKGTVTYGEFFTESSIAMPASNYTRPVAIVNGMQDLPFCFGDCQYPTDLGRVALNMLYPSAKNPSVYYAQNAGHGINLHYSATDAYRWIQSYLKNNGL